MPVISGRPAAGGVPPVVLVGCGARKAAGPAVAADLYTGPYFRACLLAALALAPRDRIFVLSARHGLLGLDDGPIAPYELTLGQPGAVDAAVIRAQAAARQIADAPVVALCGARYAALARRVWATVGTPLAGLGIGRQRHVLALLRTGQYAALQQTGGTMIAPSELRLPALEVTQAPGVAMYLFAVDGKLLGQFASVAQIRREGPDCLLRGYQRTRVARHITEIRRYLDSPGALLPNALTIAFDDRVRFEPLPLPAAVPYARFGELLIPAGDLAGLGLPGWLVDGQQRAAAIEEAARASMPVAVAAFIDADPARQREQFLRVNATRPLPKSLIYELIPVTGGPLPAALERRRLPALLTERLNYDPKSPLHLMILTATNPGGLIKDNSMMRTLAQSASDGALYPYLRDGGRRPDIDGMLEVVTNFWAAVRDVFPEAWGLPPRKSRLMHGAGVVALGFVMDAIADEREQPPPSPEDFAAGLELLAPYCRWTAGTWEFGPGWNHIQNIGRDADLLTDFLTRRYRELACRDGAAGRPHAENPAHREAECHASRILRP